MPVTEAIARLARVIAAGGSKYAALISRFGVSDFGQLLQAAARMTAEHLAGAEKAAALITSVFLHGTQNQAGST